MDEIAKRCGSLFGGLFAAVVGGLPGRECSPDRGTCRSDYSASDAHSDAHAHPDTCADAYSGAYTRTDSGAGSNSNGNSG